MQGGKLNTSITKKEWDGILDKFYELETHGKVQAEYIWIGGGGELRSKGRTLNSKPENISEIPEWNYDGSSTNQADGSNSEVLLKPVKFVSDPFRKGENILVMCETLDAKEEPLETNKRHRANEIFEKKEVKGEEPWFGLEQEYTLFNSNGRTPLGWPDNGFPAPQGPYYCGVGTGKAVGREIAEAHYEACLYAGIDIGGINAEVMCGQWEFQVGPCIGIDMGDQLYLSRYLLERVAEKFNVIVSFEPKPIKGDWNGAGCHTNFSTNSTRAEGGFDKIISMVEKLKLKHAYCMQNYGKDNEKRLTGSHETAKFDAFSYGVADRGASVRIGRETAKNKKGYFEDRRPASNCDPYLVTGILADIAIAWDGKKKKINIF